MENKSNTQDKDIQEIVKKLAEIEADNKAGLERLTRLSDYLYNLRIQRGEQRVIIFDDEDERQKFDSLMMDYDTEKVNAEVTLNDGSIKPARIIKIDDVKYLEDNGKHIKYTIGNENDDSLKKVMVTV